MTVALLESGLRVESKYSSRVMYWNLIDDITFTNEFILIYVDRKVKVIVPRRAFASKENADQFEETILFCLKSNS